MEKHNLISSVCISKNGAMIWNYTDSSNFLTMKKLNLDEIKSYLSRIKDKEFMHTVCTKSKSLLI